MIDEIGNSRESMWQKSYRHMGMVKEGEVSSTMWQLQHSEKPLYLGV